MQEMLPTIYLTKIERNYKNARNVTKIYLTKIQRNHKNGRNVIKSFLKQKIMKHHQLRGIIEVQDLWTTIYLSTKEKNECASD
jgi:hypothetical protein